MPAVYDFIARELRRRLTASATCLEIGCGAKQYRPFVPGRYLGLDLATSPYLKEAPEIIGSVEAIALPDASIDLVFGVGVFCLVADVVLAFRECRRVLKNGGKLLIFDYQKKTLDRLWEVDRQSQHRWDFQELRDELCRAGFQRSAVLDITAATCWRGQGILGTAKAASYRLGIVAGTWLVCEAAA